MRVTRGLVRAVLPLLMATALASGCGSAGSDNDGIATAGGSGGGGGAAGTSGPQDPEEAALAFARCMREHGVDIPDPSTDDNGMVQLGPGDGSAFGGGNQEVFEEAHEACKDLLPAIGGGPGGALSEEDKERMLQFAECMRDNGIDMPDPDFSSDGEGTIDLGEDSEQLEAAHKACAEFMDGEGPE